MLHGPSLSLLRSASAAPPPPSKLQPTAQPVSVAEKVDYSGSLLRSVLCTLGWLLLLYVATACYHDQSQARTVNAEPARLLDAGAYEPGQAVPSGPQRSGVKSAVMSGRKPPTR